MLIQSNNRCFFVQIVEDDGPLHEKSVRLIESEGEKLLMVVYRSPEKRGSTVQWLADELPLEVVAEFLTTARRILAMPSPAVAKAPPSRQKSTYLRGMFWPSR